MRRTVRTEAGSALLAAVILGLALAAAATTAVGAAEHARRTSERTRDRVVALGAAEAAIAEATARLVADDAFAAAASAGRDVGDPALTDWVGLDGTAAYRYGVSVVGEETVVRGRGRAGSAERVVEVALRPRGFADLHRFTDVEVIDPHVVPGTIVASCDRTRWAVPPREAGCPEAVYGPEGVLPGPLHTNDVLVVRGTPTFAGPVSTGWIGEQGDPALDPLWRGADASAQPDFRTPPRHHGLIALPASVDSIALPEAGVCHYHGPTSIRLDGARMRVWSPGSEVQSPGSPPTTPECGQGGLAGRVTVDLPASGIVRVHAGVPGCLVHPLGLDRAEEHDGGYGCADGDALVWGTYAGRLTILAEHDVHLVWDVVAADPGRTSTDALGIVAGRSIVVRRPVTLPVRGSAPHGRNLPVAGPGIGPFGAFPLDSPTPEPSAWVSPRIEAHLLAIGRSVRIQNPSRGQRNTGVLTVRGSIGQRFRGPFELPIPGSTTVTGYADRTLAHPGVLRRPPPAFPSLGDGTWVAVRWRELSPDDR